MVAALTSDPTSTSLATRGPASVAGHGHGHSSHHSRTASSTLSSSRARRYNRSHAGGVSFLPQNEFPVFSHSGDVEILVKVASGHENRYLLHRHTLTRCSGFFEASTSDQWSRAQQLPDSPVLQPAATGAIEAVPAGSDIGGRKGSANGDELARITEGRGGGGDNNSRDGSHAPPLSYTGLVGAPKKRWRYELDPGTDENDIPMLIQKEESSASNGAAPSNSIFGGTSSHSRTKSSTSHSNNRSFFRSVANLALNHSSVPSLPPPTLAEQDLLRNYDNLFRVMYNYPPLLDGINIADAYVQCKSLLTLADQYDALAVVGPRVDHHLLQFQSRLWKQIAKYPISYLRLGYLARSKVIFQEALIHVVGQWPAGERSLRTVMPDAVLDIIEDKVDELEETVSRVEAKLFRLNLTNRTGERVAPHTNYLDWLAVSLFRQWFADHTTPAPPLPTIPDRITSSSRNNNNSSSLRPSRTTSNTTSSSASSHHHQQVISHGRAIISPPSFMGRTYRTIGSSNSAAYLGHDECKRFLKLTPELYSRDNLRRFVKRMDEIKAVAREVVRPLMGSGLELENSRDRGADAVGYLTCVAVGDRDLPWNYG